MGSSWNVKREEHSVAELEEIVAGAKREVEESEWTRPDSRERTEAANTLRFYQRRLDAAKEKEERRARDDAKDPRDLAREINDRLDGR